MSHRLEIRRDTPPVAGRMLAMRRGFRNRCPACGEGRLFRACLKVADACPVCRTEFHHHRADDLPPYLVIFIVAHVVGYGILVAETDFQVPIWLHLAVWPALTLVLALGLLQPVKGAVVGLQYALGMHGFGAARGDPPVSVKRQEPESGPYESAGRNGAPEQRGP